MSECPYLGKRKSNGMWPCESPERIAYDHIPGEMSSPCRGDTPNLCAACQRAEKHKAWAEGDELRARAEAAEAKVEVLEKRVEAANKALYVALRSLLVAWDAAKKGVTE